MPAAMKTLALFRHAKSDWSDPSLDDFARPLNPRGSSAAARMAAEFAALGLEPSLILCSPARRARETLALILPAFAHEMLIRLEQRLYMASDEEMLTFIREVDDAVPSLLVIGHNPGMQGLAVSLAGKGDSQSLTALQAKFPTAALALFSLPDKPWRKLKPQEGNLKAFVIPKSLPAQAL